MKLYNYSTRGYLYEVELVPPSQYGNMIPASGCDILIRDKSGFLNSANSESYHATPELALAAFVERQRKYIAQTRERLSRELDALATATREPIASK